MKTSTPAGVQLKYHPATGAIQHLAFFPSLHCESNQLGIIPESRVRMPSSGTLDNLEQVCEACLFREDQRRVGHGAVAGSGA